MWLQTLFIPALKGLLYSTSYHSVHTHTHTLSSETHFTRERTLGAYFDISKVFGFWESNPRPHATLSKDVNLPATCARSREVSACGLNRLNKQYISPEVKGFEVSPQVWRVATNAVYTGSERLIIQYDLSFCTHAHSE